MTIEEARQAKKENEESQAVHADRIRRNGIVTIAWSKLTEYSDDEVRTSRATRKKFADAIVNLWKAIKEAGHTDLIDAIKPGDAIFEIGLGWLRLARGGADANKIEAEITGQIDADASHAGSAINFIKGYGFTLAGNQMVRFMFTGNFASQETPKPTKPIAKTKRRKKG